MTELIDKIHDRVTRCFGVNPLPFDRLFKGNKEESAYWMEAVRERREMLATLNTAAHLIAERDAELSDLRETVKASGNLSMGLGAKRVDKKPL